MIAKLMKFMVLKRLFDAYRSRRRTRQSGRRR